MTLSLGRMLTGLFLAVLLVMAAQGVYAIVSLNGISEGTETFLKKRVPALVALGQLNSDLGDVRVAQGAYLSASDASLKAKRLQDLDKAVASVVDQTRAYAPFIVDKEDQDYFDSFKKGWDSYLAHWQQIKAASDAGDASQARALFYGDTLDIYNKTGDIIQAAMDDLQTNVNEEGSINLRGVHDTTSTTQIALGLAVVLVLASIVISRRRMIVPIAQMTSQMKILSGGDTSHDVPFRARRDEIGAMAAALQIFKDGILRNRALEAEAITQRERAEAEKIRLQKEADEAAQRKLQEATAGLAAGLQRLAAGDLSFQLTEAFAPEFEALRRDLNTAIGQLGATIATVSESAVAIGAGSREVSDSANDLSRRTEQQAASLEQTAAALDEITANVSNSTKRVAEARDVAKQANDGAVQSGIVVAEAISAMQRIEQSSSQISNIISVIDEIAFQTNLLALNAGVEAARAGEAGRGFAVVATEVRELAQRSARAAREIKELINNSVQEVESGVRKVEQTGSVLKSIEHHVTTINNLMEAITTASREQSVGLSEVNTAVNQMDQVTQQNAAMVEEANAASANLAQESQRLQSLVGGFKVQAGDRRGQALQRAA
ncbi:methyl-accepting chemotaxis protein [Allorhizobium sp. BGMRC 0089]|uniref:HAMP domain-containing methyl-accepting chemotaxis protein n=1 Tax=Allorhizobium sonneratiae TaxID=2934936 RepID=UPI00203449CA|nr:methyl-accepting chemotaxis protein [Allorhizobium sonneratiae]MCM2294180.1 methyl-accepting chemotaxis protein [Allorhizobium sonneratiae]